MNTPVNKIAILVNRSACQGRARERWKRIRTEVINRITHGSIELCFDGQIDLHTTLEDLIFHEKVNGIISAGGDGSMHHLVNTLMKGNKWDPKTIALGAIGLGSSNDFHKPFKTKLDGIPIRIGHQKLQLVDLGKVQYLTPEGLPKERYFMINASLGITAEANQFFNNPNKKLKLLKKNWTAAAILYAAIKTIFNYENIEVTLRYNGIRKTTPLSILTILKNPNISGNLKYDQEIAPDDGWLGLNYGEDLSKKGLFQLLLDLGKGEFTGKRKRYSKKVKSVAIDVNEPVLLEMDGEVEKGSQFAFSIVPQAINLMKKN